MSKEVVTEKQVKELEEIANGPDQIDQKTQFEQSIKIIKMQHQAGHIMVKNGIYSLCSVMIDSRSNQLKKIQAMNALLSAFNDALSFGVEKHVSPEPGQVLAKERDHLTKVILKTMESQQIIIANNNYQKQGEKNGSTESSKTEGV